MQSVLHLKTKEWINSIISCMITVFMIKHWCLRKNIGRMYEECMKNVGSSKQNYVFFKKVLEKKLWEKRKNRIWLD